MNFELSMLSVVDNSFATYAAMTIQDRAIVDARDGLKPSQRQCMYSLLVNKYIHSKPFVKSQECVGRAMADYYVHGDSSCYDLLARMARPYNMRYPLMDFKGQFGPISTGVPSSPRYTDMRLGKLGEYLFNDIEKECIDIWFDNYSNTKVFPSVVPSLGYYNICNGTSGIATSLSSSIPSFNVKEVNEAMIKLLRNPDISFDEIYCAPDFGIGGTILNANEVKEILRYGGGENVKDKLFNGKPMRSSVRMRATATVNEEERAIYFTEVPFGVYTHTIVEQIVDKLNSGEIVGISKDGIKDLSKNEANLKIIYEKGVNPASLIKKLFKLTDLDTFYPINLLMLDKGTSPKLFTWKEALQAHIDHEISTRTKIHEFEVKEIDARLNVVEGLLIALANVDEVVEIIRNSNDKDEAKSKLSECFGFNSAQTDAILRLTLGKLMHLEIQSFVNEKEQLLAAKEKHTKILTDKNLLFDEIEAGFREVINKLGDERKTRLTNFDFASEAEDAEPIEKKELLITYTNFGNVYAQETSTLISQKRGGKGTNFKMKPEEIVVQSISTDNLGWLYAFTNKGRLYSVRTSDISLGKNNVNTLFEFADGEKLSYLTTFSKKTAGEYFYFITKCGMIKKTEVSEYKTQKKGLLAIKLKDNDEVINVFDANGGNIGILSSSGKFIVIDGSEVSVTSRNSMGVTAMKLKDNEEVIAADKIRGNTLITASKYGMVKKGSMDDFKAQNRGGSGILIAGTSTNDVIVDFLTFDKDCDIMIVSSKKNIRVNSSQFSLQSRTAKGSKGISLEDNEIVTSIVKA